MRRIHPQSSRSHSSRSRAITSACEPLETRRLLSTINWANKGTVATPTDNFDVFGANETLARNIVQRAIDDWELVIANFNYNGGGNTYTVNISAADLGPGSRGSTGGVVYQAVTQKPLSANITLDDNGGGTGWYLDPVIGTSAVPDDGEFTTFQNEFQGNAAVAGFDFYRTAAHEIGHAMGLASSSPLLQAIDVNIGADPNGGTLFTIDVNGVAGADYTYTNSGGFHLWEGTGPTGGTPIGAEPVHNNELMNSGRTAVVGRRQLISNTITTLLRDAYDYTVTLPSTLNTFYANLNTSTNVLTINGDIDGTGDDADIIDLEVDGTAMRFEVNSSAETIDGAEFTTINVNAGLAADDVDVDQLLAGKTLTVNLGDGNDQMDVALEDNDIDTIIDSNFTVNGGIGADTAKFNDLLDGPTGDFWNFSATVVDKGGRTVTYSGIELLDVRGSAQPTTYNIDATGPGTNLTAIAGVGNDIFNVAAGDFDTNLGGDVTLNGGGGSNPLTLDDTTDGLGGDVYTFTTTELTKPGQLLSHTGLGSISVLGGDSPSTYNINSTSIPLTIACGDGLDVVNIGDAVATVGAGAGDINAIVSVNGGVGDDQFFVGNGDLDEMTQPVIINGGGPTGGLNNLLRVNDLLDTGANQYDLVDGLLTKGEPSDFISLNYSFINDTVIDLNPEANVFNFTNGFGFPVIEGNGGADVFNIISSIASAQTPTIHGGAGLDDIRVNEDEVGTATAVLDQDEDLNFLYLFEGSTVNVASNANTGIVAESVGFLQGILNLNNNFLVVHSSTTPFVVDKITRGYNNGAWNGAPAGGASGVIRSATAAGSGLGDGLGYADVGAAAGELNIANYRGVPLVAGDLIVSYTLYGDNNLNRTVDINDFSNLGPNFNVVGTNWVRGNYNYDNTTNISDFSLLGPNFNLSVPGDLPRGGITRGGKISAYSELLIAAQRMGLDEIVTKLESSQSLSAV